MDSFLNPMGLIECTPPTASIDYVRWSPAKKERMKDILVKIPAPRYPCPNVELSVDFFGSYVVGIVGINFDHAWPPT